MSTFLHSLPTNELDELMKLVQGGCTSKFRTAPPVLPSSFLTFETPTDLELEPDHCTNSEQINLCQRQRASTSPPVSSFTKRAEKEKEQSQEEQSMKVNETSNPSSATKISSSSPPRSSPLPYCTQPSHTHSHTLDLLERFAPTAGDITSLDDLERIHAQVIANRRKIEIHDTQIADLKDSVVLDKIEVTRRQIEERHYQQQQNRVENELDQAARNRLAAHRKISGSPVAFGSTMKNRNSTQMTSPYAGRYHTLMQQQDAQQQSQRRPHSTSQTHPSQAPSAAGSQTHRVRFASPSSNSSIQTKPKRFDPNGEDFTEQSSPASTDDNKSNYRTSPSLTRPPGDPLARDIIHELTSELIQLQQKYHDLQSNSLQEIQQLQDQLQQTKDESRLTISKLKKSQAAKLSNLSTIHTEKLKDASLSNQNEVVVLRGQVAQMTQSLQQSRELLKVYLKERGSKEKRAMQEQQLLNLLCQPHFLENTQPPANYPSAVPVCMNHSPNSIATVPPFASSLLTSVPSSALPYSLVNDELTSLRLNIQRLKDELKQSKASEAEATSKYQELILVHKKFKQDANIRRLRLQAQLLGSVRRVQWATQEKERLDQLNKEQQTYVQQVEAKLLIATKRLIAIQEHAELRQSARALTQANLETEARGRRRQRTLSLSPSAEARVKAGRLGSISSPHLQDRLTQGAPKAPLPIHVALEAAEYAENMRQERSAADRPSTAPARGESVASTLRPTSAPTFAPTSPQHSYTYSNSSDSRRPLSSPEADRWMHQLEDEVEALQVQLDHTRGQPHLPLRSPAARTASTLSTSLPHPSPPRPSLPSTAASHSNQDERSPPVVVTTVTDLHQSSGGDDDGEDDDGEAEEVDLDDTSSVSSFMDGDDADEFDEDELIRTFGSSQNATSSFVSSFNSSDLSLKDQLNELTTKKLEVDQQLAKMNLSKSH